MILPPFGLERFLARFEFAVEHHLCASDCESMSVGELLSLEPGAAEALAELPLSYTESQGSPGLRRRIAGLYQTVSAEDVLVCCGAEEAIFLFAQASLGPGERVMVMEPCYRSLADLPRSLGCEVIPWTLRPTGRGRDPAAAGRGWDLDMDELRAQAPGLRAAIINSPHNPTGHLMSRQAVNELNELSQQYGFLVFSDEVYGFLEDESERSPSFCDLGPGHVSLGVMSKTFGLPGLRIGWVATRNKALLGAMAGLKDYTTICSPAPSEFLAETALAHWPRLAGRSQETIAVNTALAEAFFARHEERFAWIPPQAGPVAFPALSRVEDAEPWCLDLARQAGVLLLPGGVYGRAWRDRFRLGLGRTGFARGLARLEEHLAS